MALEGKPITVVPAKIERGSRFYDMGNGAAAMLTAQGKLILCDKCTRYEWECKEGPHGSTVCTKVCVEWTCREVPA